MSARVRKAYRRVPMPADHQTTRLNGWVEEHILVAERALGRQLESHRRVHHHDENGLNNANTNLVVCENEAYHQLLHARMRIIKAGGDPDIQKICGRCRNVKAKSDFHLSRTVQDGRSRMCIACDKSRHFSSPRARRMVAA